jgi:phage virion morphogenesis protein
MSDDDIRLRVETDTITSGLAELKKRGTDMLPVMATIGEALVGNIQENFEQEGRYSSVGDWRGGSVKWRGLAPSTVKKRGTAHPILQASADMFSTIGKEASSTGVAVGVGKLYAAIHNFGGKAGRGRKVTIPARPFMTVSDENIKEIQSRIGDYLLKGKA